MTVGSKIAQSRSRLAVFVIGLAVIVAQSLFGPVAHGQKPGLCEGFSATIVGTNGSERIDGTSGNDVISARGGDDIVFGHGGDDIICGKAGRDD